MKNALFFCCSLNISAPEFEVDLAEYPHTTNTPDPPWLVVLRSRPGGWNNGLTCSLCKLEDGCLSPPQHMQSAQMQGQACHFAPPAEVLRGVTVAENHLFRCPTHRLGSPSYPALLFSCYPYHPARSEEALSPAPLSLSLLFT